MTPPLTVDGRLALVAVLLRRSHGPVALRELPATHPSHPGLWAPSAEGWVEQAETAPQAAVRLARDDLGAKGAWLAACGWLDLEEHDGAWKQPSRVWVFVATFDGPVALARGAGVRLEFLHEAQLAREIVGHARRVTPTLLAAFGMARAGRWGTRAS